MPGGPGRSTQSQESVIWGEPITKEEKLPPGRPDGGWERREHHSLFLLTLTPQMLLRIPCLSLAL